MAHLGLHRARGPSGARAARVRARSVGSLARRVLRASPVATPPFGIGRFLVRAMSVPTPLLGDGNEIADDFGILQSSRQSTAAVREREIAVRKVVLVADLDVAGAHVLGKRPRVRGRSGPWHLGRLWFPLLSRGCPDSGASRANRILLLCRSLIVSLTSPFRRRRFRGDTIGLCDLKRRVFKFLARLGVIVFWGDSPSGLSPIEGTRESDRLRPRVHSPKWRGDCSRRWLVLSRVARIPSPRARGVFSASVEASSRA